MKPKDPVGIGVHPHRRDTLARGARAVPRPSMSPENRELFEKTLAAIRQIMGGLGEIPSKRLACELAQIEGGPWSKSMGLLLTVK